ncbi:meiotic recombination protein SPO11 [Polypterus senegalus]|uniref:meiotic recombination protein SPO11 n=1 Tax=Polypterus senegalus TaxID=55291 RepID=UPI0019625B72|nr:meiotic recombination protein SPO11 [Polypterus senegalus]
MERLQTTLRCRSERSKEEENDIPNSKVVLKTIENIIKEVLLSLSRGEAPQLRMHNRLQWANNRFHDSTILQKAEDCSFITIKSNSSASVTRFALILKMLSVIYKLVQSNTYATKRDIFYCNKGLFGTQRTVDKIIDDICCMLLIPRLSLHVLATSKGLIAGNLCYTEEDGTRVNCASNSMAVLVPSSVQGIKYISSSAQYLLIVEKDATFQRLLDDNFLGESAHCIIITGKGFPDLNTRLMVRKLWEFLQIPVFALVDADPYGIEIICIYKYGSMSMSFQGHRLTVPSIMWLGLLPSDLERLIIPKDALIPLTKTDYNKLASMQKSPYIMSQPLWQREIDIIRNGKMKAEIQSLTALAPDYLTRVYLPNKLHFGGWI